jgi:hypothetical protein
MQATDDFDFAFLDDAHPETRRGFMVKVITGLVGMRRAAIDDPSEVGGGNAHTLGDGGDAFRRDIHSKRMRFQRGISFSDQAAND